MPYTLITSKGKVMTFHVLALAETYQIFHGGSIFTKEILEEKPSDEEVSEK